MVWHIQIVLRDSSTRRWFEVVTINRDFELAKRLVLDKYPDLSVGYITTQPIGTPFTFRNEYIAELVNF